jgi:hypothetical protein
MDDFEMRAQAGFLLAEDYRQAGDIEKALRVCEKLIEREKEVDQEYHNIDIHIFYAECLIEPGVRSKNNLLKAYEIFQLMDRMVYEARPKLVVQFGLASCWAHNIPTKPKTEDIILIGKKILDAFDQDWKVYPAFEEKEQILRLWNPQLNLFIDQFATLASNICWEICEMMRSRFLLIDLGYSMNYFSPNSWNDLVKEEAELASQLRKLNDKIKQLHESPPIRDSFLQLQRLDGPESIASLDKQRKNIDRKRSYILHQLSQSSDRDKESVDLRTGASISYSELQELLIMK